MFTDEENLPIYTELERAATEIIRKHSAEIKELHLEADAIRAQRDRAIALADVFQDDVKAWKRKSMWTAVIAIVSLTLLTICRIV